MAKYGKLMEYTPAMGDLRILCRTVRPTYRACGPYQGMIDKGWVLAQFIDNERPNWLHSEQLRPVDNRVG